MAADYPTVIASSLLFCKSILDKKPLLSDFMRHIHKVSWGGCYSQTMFHCKAQHARDSSASCFLQFSSISIPLVRKLTFWGLLKQGNSKFLGLRWCCSKGSWASSHLWPPSHPCILYHSWHWTQVFSSLQLMEFWWHPMTLYTVLEMIGCCGSAFKPLCFPPPSLGTYLLRYFVHSSFLQLSEIQFHCIFCL